MKKLLLLLAFSLPLLAQDAYDTPEEVDKEITKQEQRENTTNEKIIIIVSVYFTFNGTRS